MWMYMFTLSEEGCQPETLSIPFIQKCRLTHCYSSIFCPSYMWNLLPVEVVESDTITIFRHFDKQREKAQNDTISKWNVNCWAKS